MPLGKQAALIIFSGLPASGKTTLSSKLAAYLQAAYIRMDAIVLGLKSDTYDPDLPRKCYGIAGSLALVNLRLGNTVVTDSINPDNYLREEWRMVAQSAGVKSVQIEIICSDRDEHQNRLKSRTTTLTGLIDPT